MSGSFYGNGATLRKLSLSPVVIILAFLGSTDRAMAADDDFLLSSASSVFFDYTIGGTVPPQTVNVTSSGSSISFNATVTTASGGNWLAVSPTAASTPAAITLSAEPSVLSNLAAGTYNGTVHITASTGRANSPLTIPVTLAVGSGATLSASPSSLSFSYQTGQAAPPAQALVFEASGITRPLDFTATISSTPSGWLSINGAAAPVTGTTPGTASVSVNPTGLAAGTYAGTVTLSSTDPTVLPQVVPVTYTTSNEPFLSASPTSLSFISQPGATVPSQTVQVTSTAGSTAFTVTPGGYTGLINVTPTSGTTPANLTIGVNPSVLAGLKQSLTPYIGTVTLKSPVGNLTVNANVYAQMAGSPLAVTSAASGQTGAVSPGEFISIYGKKIGPATPAGLSLTSNGNIATVLGNIQVTFDGVPAPLTYVSADQINVIVPYEVSGRLQTQMQVDSNGTVSNTTFYVVPTVPAIFTVAGGTGQAAAQNQNGSVNDATNPAAPGSTVVLYGTGEGALNPQPPTGSVTSSSAATYPQPILPVTVNIGGQNAEVVYAGEAPGLASGVLQVNVTIPAGTASGSIPIVLTIGGATSQSGVTVTVR